MSFIEMINKKKKTTLIICLAILAAIIALAFVLSGFINKPAISKNDSQKIEELLGCSVFVPKKATDCNVYIVEEEKACELSFNYQGEDYVATAIKSDTALDMTAYYYYGWEYEAPCCIDKCDAKVNSTIVGSINALMCQWFDSSASVMYCVYTENEFPDIDTLEAVSAAFYCNDEKKYQEAGEFVAIDQSGSDTAIADNSLKNAQASVEGSSNESTFNEDATIANFSDDFYTLATGKSSQEVEDYAKDVKELIEAESWDEIFDLCAFPIFVDGNEVADSDALSALFEENNVSSDFIEAIKNESCNQMYVNSSGIAMGNGEIWLADVENEDGSFMLKIISFNSLFE